MEKIKCPICNMDNAKHLFNVDRFNNLYAIVKCNSCNLVYANPQPTEEELREHYSKNYGYGYMEQKEAGPKDKIDILEIMKFKSRKGKLLDIGCGSGLFLSNAEKQGWQVKGIDLSSKMVNYGKEKFGLNLTCSNFLENGEMDSYDVVTMRHFLEHTINPVNYVEKAKRVLREDGLLLIILPNINSFAAKINGKKWQWMSPPAHLFFFSSQTIIKLLESQGFSVLKIKTRRGDASSLLSSIVISVISMLGAWDYLKARTENKNQKKNNNKKDYLNIIKIIDILGFLLIPVEIILDKMKMGPELIVYAKKN